MTDRAGPPTPRPATPYRRPTHAEAALTFGMGDEGAYEARTAAWKRYWEEHCADWTPITEFAERDGFFAGWAARTAFNHAPKKTVDKPAEPVVSFFPTDAELDNGK